MLLWDRPSLQAPRVRKHQGSVSFQRPSPEHRAERWWMWSDCGAAVLIWPRWSRYLTKSRRSHRLINLRGKGWIKLRFSKVILANMHCKSFCVKKMPDMRIIMCPTYFGPFIGWAISAKFVVKGDCKWAKHYPNGAKEIPYFCLDTQIPSRWAINPYMFQCMDRMRCKQEVQADLS